MDSKEHKPNADNEKGWIITLGENLRVRTDEPNNWVIEQKLKVLKGKNAGQDRWVALGYYGTVNLCMLAIFQKHTTLIEKEKTVMRLKALNLKLKEYAALISASCSDLDKKLKEVRKAGAVEEK